MVSFLCSRSPSLASVYAQQQDILNIPLLEVLMKEEPIVAIG
jgi:hypothetical protein